MGADNDARVRRSISFNVAAMLPQAKNIQYIYDDRLPKRPFHLFRCELFYDRHAFLCLISNAGSIKVKDAKIFSFAKVIAGLRENVYLCDLKRGGMCTMQSPEQ